MRPANPYPMQGIHRKTSFHPLADAKDKANYKEALRLLSQHTASKPDLLANRRKLSSAIKQMKNEYNHLDYKISKHSEAEKKLRYDLRILVKKITPCELGINCTFYVERDGENSGYQSKRTQRACAFFHTHEEIKFFEQKEQERVNEYNEGIRMKNEMTACEADAKLYCLNYCSLGINIKAALNSFSLIVPDEISALIRSYCAKPEFKRSTPTQHFYDTFKSKAYRLHPCPKCEDRMHYNFQPPCSLCNHPIMNIDELYILRAKVQDNREILVHFLHGHCADVLGLAAPTDYIAGYIKGDVKMVDEKDSEVRLYRAPSNICIGNTHSCSARRSMDIIFDDVWTISDVL